MPALQRNILSAAIHTEQEIQTDEYPRRDQDRDEYFQRRYRRFARNLPVQSVHKKIINFRMPFAMTDIYREQYVFKCDSRILRGDPKRRDHIVHVLT